ncbi:MAG: S8 family serine peptidase [Acidimicrobiia bacterium]|nr:S8 family serine peptidase [Acidimicrobiia bacterium]
MRLGDPGPGAPAGRVLLSGPGEERRADEEARAALAHATRIVEDPDGSVWAELDTPGGSTTVAATPPAGPETFSGVPGIVDAKRVDDEHVALTTTLSPEQVAALPGVAAVDEDPLLMPFEAPDDPLFPSLWGLENTGANPGAPAPVVADADVDASEAWPRARGAGSVVAVVDNGVDLDHPDLAPNLWRNPGEVCGNGVDDDGNGYADDCHGWDFLQEDPRTDDGADYSHGTHVAGTIAAVAGNGLGVAGVAPEARIMALKVGDGRTFQLSTAVRALDYAVANGATVVNASWGTYPGTPAPRSRSSRAPSNGPGRRASSWSPRRGTRASTSTPRPRTRPPSPRRT